MRLGIMGGTFDPIHLGHLGIARAAMSETGLDEILFLPDGDPPHKSPGASPLERYQMVCLALRDEPGFYASDMELVRAGRTYTVDTLLELKAQNSTRELYYIIGSDTLFQFPTWKTAKYVAQLCCMLVVLRQGDKQAEEVRQAQHQLLTEFGLRSTLLNARGPDISSSKIREAVSRGEEIRTLVPAKVAEYIYQHKLYL